MSNSVRYYAYKAASYALYCAPLAVLFGINHEQYIKEPGAALGFFGYIIIMFAVIAGKGKFTEYAKKDMVLTVSLVVFLLSLIMQYLASQFLLISSASLGGCLLTRITEPVADVYFSEAYTLTDGRKIKTLARPLSHKTAWRRAYGFPVKEE